MRRAPQYGAVLAALAAAAAVFGQAGVQEGTRKKMMTELEEVRLPDEAFWDSSNRDHGLDPIVERYKTEYFGILIDGPREVAIQTRQTLPVFTYYMGSYKQAATRRFPHQAAVVAMRPERNEIYVESFVRKRGETQLRGSTVPADRLPAGYLMTFQDLEVRSRAELPWEAGRVITQVLLMDLASNRLETKLVAGSGAFVDEEKEKFLAAERARANPPGPYPARDPEAAPVAGKPPAVPEGMGVTLSAERVAVLNPKGTLALHGSFRLPVLPEETVKAGQAAYNKANGLVKEDGEPYAASMAIHLVAMSTGEEVPSAYTLRIPVEKVEMAEGKPVASGTFSIDLLGLTDFPVGDETLFLYAFAKEWASEAAVIGVVDKRR